MGLELRATHCMCDSLTQALEDVVGLVFSLIDKPYPLNNT